jgi:hypothetical protein
MGWGRKRILAEEKKNSVWKRKGMFGMLFKDGRP